MAPSVAPTHRNTSGSIPPPRHATAAISLVAILGLALACASVARADYASGLEAFNQGDLRSAEAEWRGPAEEGDMNAQFGMGTLFERGLDGQPDPVEALRWYRMAASQGSAEAKYNIGRIYAAGGAIERDMTQASYYWLEAADAGHAPSMHNVGVMYYQGAGVEKDPQQAEEWFRRAAVAGFANAQHMLGEMKRRGVNGPPDPVAAMEWLTAAARQGHGPARSSLFEMQREASDQAVPNDEGLGRGVAGEVPSGTAASVAARASGSGLPGSDGNGGADTAVGASAVPPQGEGVTTGNGTPAAAPAPVSRAGTALPPPSVGSAGSGAAAPGAIAATGQAAAGTEAPTSTVRTLGTIPARPGTPLTTARYTVWLASFPEQVDAELHWRDLQDRHPDLLGPLTPTFEPVDRGGNQGSVVRLYAGPIDSQRGAEDLCNLLKRRVRDAFCTPRQQAR